jgi:glycerol-3-phosphate dehydrogenase
MSTSAPLALQPIERERLLQSLRDPQPWDAVIVGGGATGLGLAVDAAQRGLRVALIDSGDFGRGTSSRSTKLIHGGVRYLAQGNIKLVREALAERATLLRIAPHLVHPLEFVVPCYSQLDRLTLRIGLGLYDLLAGSASIGPTRWLSPAQTVARLSGIKRGGLRGGVAYWDAQFDDALMCIALMQTAVALGAVAINYVGCVGLATDARGVCAVHAQDAETGERFVLNTRCVFNAAGVWVDVIRRLALPEASPLIRVSQGSHVVVDRHFMPAESALLIPRTRDGRVLFVVPWKGRLLIGTTDQSCADAPFEPRPSESEIEFLLATAAEYLAQPIARVDVRAGFTGLRPLYSLKRSGPTARISREHAVLTECGGLISVVGGKWTTYRKMAADALAAAAHAGLLPAAEPATAHLALLQDAELIAGARNAATARAALDDPDFQSHCRRYTQARNADDVLFRRVRLGELDTAGSAGNTGKGAAAAAP